MTFPEWKETGSSTSLVLKALKAESSVRKVFLPKTVSMALTEEKDRQQRAKEKQRDLERKALNYVIEFNGGDMLELIANYLFKEEKPVELEDGRVLTPEHNRHVEFVRAKRRNAGS